MVAGIGMYFGGPWVHQSDLVLDLCSGRSTEEALRNAALAGATTYAWVVRFWKNLCTLEATIIEVRLLNHTTTNAMYSE